MEFIIIHNRQDSIKRLYKTDSKLQYITVQFNCANQKCDKKNEENLKLRLYRTIPLSCAATERIMKYSSSKSRSERSEIRYICMVH